jgi:hypothetical protein
VKKTAPTRGKPAGDVHKPSVAMNNKEYEPVPVASVKEITGKEEQMF